MKKQNRGSNLSSYKLLILAFTLLIVFTSITGCAKKEAPVAKTPTIKVAVAGPMAFVHGDHKWKGAVLAAEEINAAGGVRVGDEKRLIELVKVDTNELLSVPDAASAIERAITVDKVDVIVGGFRSEAVLAMQDVAMDHKILHLGVGAITHDLTDKVVSNYDRYKYYFRTVPFKAGDVITTSFLLLQEAAAVVREELGIPVPKVAILVEKVLGFDPVAAAAPQAIPTMGMEVVGTVWRPSQTATDVTAELTAIRESGAHIIYSILSGPVGIVYARQWEEMQIPAVSIGINVEAQAGGFWQSTGGKGNYETTLSFLSRVAVTEKTIPFYDKFLATYKEAPLYLAGSYDTIYMLAEAIERAGSLDSDALVVEMEKTDYIGTSGRFVFDERHDPKWGPQFQAGLGVQWIDGKQVVFWPFGWQGVKHEGAVRYTIPPWVVKHWKQ
ncbi:MAG: ABC transporter substrate-binding protein [Dethiobacter sp.]|jgi:branched-chain amino acid transport system substrate-binding protein|nr:ABC transporter substrate-binding protein [Dethiobacter sp.]